MIHELATVELREGTRPSFLKEFHRVMPLVRAESGCIEYGASIDLATEIPVQLPLRPDVAVIVEKWESLAHLKAHLGAAHMAEYRGRVKDFVKQVTLQVLEPA